MHSRLIAVAVRRPDRRGAGRLALLLTLVFAIVLASAPLSDARRAAAHGNAQAAPPAISTVTLITGDVVHMVTRRDGRRSFSFEPGADGTIPDAAITEVGEHAYVVPRAAMSLVAAKRLDLDLFDVAGLVRQRYDDAHRATVPVIVDYGRGIAAAAEARKAVLAHARKTVTIASLGAAAFAADKEHTRAFWRSLTAADVARVDLDGRVRATIDPPVSQIHAPEAWATGYDGSGSTVAVLDTGYDATHPDLAGIVERAANFTTDATTTDGNGHGTHVASTIAGTGAASARLHGGVAPGAKLLVGKVLADAGFGEDSWVLAGMQWAVEQGADVVNMSLGGEVSDGSDPLSLAIDELSAASDTLFVVAAGNAGSDPGTVTAPGSADAALTVGAVDGSDTLAYFSSRGPRIGDGAVKPDIVAPGVDITAARAAGTALGRPVDEWYTSLDGTSMATPHVAGVAAIVKQRHPAWDGERIKAAITGSAVSAPSATAFEAGTGRVDTLRALGTTVVSGPALNLGSYPWPQQGLAPTRTPLRYENLGVAPVTLALSVAAQDNAAGAPAGVSLSASTLTLAPGGAATVDVLLDPSVPGVGTFSGVVVADPGAGSSVRTGFGFSLESEHYDVTVELRPRAGTRRASHLVGLTGLDNGFFELRTLEGSGTTTTSFRVPPGTYSTGGLTFGLAADRAEEGVLAYEPSLSVGADTTVVLDEEKARPFDVVTERVALTDGQIMSVDWNGEAGFSNVTLAGGFDRVFAQPLASSDAGSVNAALNWMLSQPDAEIALPGARPVLLRLLASGGRIDGSYRLVDAGTVAALDTSSVRGAIAVVAGDCTDLSAAAAALELAEAAAMVAYPGDGVDCAGTLAAPAELPAFQVLPFDAARLLGSPQRQLRVTTHDSPAYVYDLAGAWSGSVPPGATLDGRARSVAAIVERYDSLGGTSAEGHFVWEMPIGWVPGRDAAAFGLVRPVAVPSTATHYVSPGVEWERIVEVKDSTGYFEGMLSAPRVAVRAGQTIRDRWFGGPIAPNVSPLITPFGWRSSPYREGDYFWLFMPTLTDDAGHVGFPFYLDEFEGKLYRDGELMFQGDFPLWLQGEAPPEAHDYRLVYTNRRQNGFWQRSTMSESAWTFSSARTVGDHEVLPLMTVDFDLALDAHSEAPPGPFSFGLSFGMPAEVEPKPIARVTVEVSWDSGATWRPASLQGCATTTKWSCTVRVRNPASGSASLRVSATDTAGRSVTQTIVDAYAVKSG